MAIEIRQVGSCVPIMVPDFQSRTVHHEDLAALQGARRGGLGPSTFCTPERLQGEPAAARGRPRPSARPRPAPPLSSSPDLEFPVLSSVVQRGPAPQVLRDLCSVQQEPAKHFGVAATGGKVHGRGAVVVLLGQAHVCEAHLAGKEWAGQRAGLELSPLRPRSPTALSCSGPSSPATQGRGCGPSAPRRAEESCRLGRSCAGLRCTPVPGTSSPPGGPPGTPGTGAWHRCWFGHSLLCE